MFNPIRTGLFEHKDKDRGGLGGARFQFFLEMTCCGMLYHIKKGFMKFGVPWVGLGLGLGPYLVGCKVIH